MSDLFARLSAALADRYTLERELGQGGESRRLGPSSCEHSRYGYVRSRDGNTYC
jgi:hypothetical protein